jgi:histone-lysine N-methyltransferase SETD1
MVSDPADPKTYVKRVDGVLNGMEVRARDPRLKIPAEVRERGAGCMKHRKDGLHTLKYEWDEHSPGPKPPPPPTAVLLTNLSPLTTVEQVSKFLRPHGRIKEIDAKMDTRSGMQLGIVWVRFDGPAPGKTGTAHDVAKNVVRMCDGQRVGLQNQERVRVVLDGRGLLAEKAVKDEMAKRNAPKPRPPPPPSAPTPAISTPSEGKQTPKPSVLSRPAPRPPPPRNPKFETFGRNFSSLSRSLPVGRFQHQPRPGLGVQAVQDFSRDFRGPAQDREHRRFPRGDLYSPATSGSRSRSRSPSTSESDSDDDFRRRRADSPRRQARGPARAAVEKKEADEAAVERVRKALATNGKAYVFIEAKSLPPTQSETNVRDHFRAFKPDQAMCNHTGWYVLFSDDQAAYRAQRVLDKTAVQGHRINIEVRTPKGEAAGPAEPEKATGGWRFLTISKNRKAAPRPPPSPKKARRRLSVSYTSSDDDEPRPRPRKSVKKEEVKALDNVPEPESEPIVEEIKVEPVDDGETKVEIEVELEPEPNKKKRAGKEAKAPKAKKARVESPPVAEVKVAPKPPKPKPRKKTVFDKLVAADLLADDEDAYWLAQALAHEGDDLELSDAEPDLDEEHPLYHTSGAWRAEGYRKVAATKKSVYLPQRNRATAAAKAAAMPGGTAVVATGRSARVEGRRLNIDLESTRKAASASHAEANDVFAFNQLRIRKKQLRFARSAIEGYGLYAMETIQPNEMVCEYVGELCRVAVSEVREQRYMKQGIGSSYLFRIDGDVVCDATFKGSVSRLVNHSCDPNCLAKIISINGVNKIVLYAKRTIHPGEEVRFRVEIELTSVPLFVQLCARDRPRAPRAMPLWLREVHGLPELDVACTYVTVCTRGRFRHLYVDKTINALQDG